MIHSFIQKNLANESTKIDGGPNDWQETEKLKKKVKKVMHDRTFDQFSSFR